MTAVGAGYRASALAVVALVALASESALTVPVVHEASPIVVRTRIALDGWRCQDVDQAAIGLPGNVDAGEWSDTPASDLPTGDAPTEADVRPTILVHGWLGSASGWEVVRERIADSFDTPPKIYRFDYSAINDDWAGQPEIAGCLAAYIAAVSQAWSDAGGDGRVLLVGHSMGGLAIRYASAYTVGGVATGDRIAGVLSVNTPHLGSAWGGTRYAEFWSTWNRVLARDTMPMPDPDSGAARCLAPRPESASVTSGGPGDSNECAGTPPYLPPDVPVRQIAGRVVLARDYFPFLGGPGLYTIHIGGDGVVTATSQHGYSFSGPPDQHPGQDVRTLTADCVVRSDVLRCAMFTATKGGIPAAVTVLLGTWFNDREVMDDIAAGTISGHWIEVLPVVTGIADCGHTRILTSDAGTAAIIDALAELMAAAPVEPPDDPWELSVDGLGPYRIGMTGAELIAAGLLVDSGPDELCGDPNTPEGRHYLAAGEFATTVGPLFRDGVMVA